MVSNRPIKEGQMGSKSQEEEGKPWMQIKDSPFPARLKNTLSSLIVAVFPSKYQDFEFIAVNCLLFYGFGIGSTVNLFSFLSRYVTVISNKSDDHYSTPDFAT